MSTSEEHVYESLIHLIKSHGTHRHWEQEYFSGISPYQRISDRSQHLYLRLSAPATAGAAEVMPIIWVYYEPTDKSIGFLCTAVTKSGNSVMRGLTTSVIAAFSGKQIRFDLGDLYDLSRMIYDYASNFTVGHDAIDEGDLPPRDDA